MMGGEFCGNAARSFGLFVAREQGLKGKGTIGIGISGAAGPILTHVDTGAGTASAGIPPPLAQESLEYEGRVFPVYVFEGIVHLIAESPGADREGGGSPREEALVRSLMRCYAKSAAVEPAAFGVMFYNPARRFMRPAVYVAATDSLVFESSCGSGSAALGAWLFRNEEDTDKSAAITQPGGLIETTVVKRGGKIERITIGGKVDLSGPMPYAIRG
jgi:diaminopimelate epimerase